MQVARRLRGREEGKHAEHGAPNRWEYLGNSASKPEGMSNQSIPLRPHRRHTMHRKK